jgi:DNA-binding transcriptional MerR regulator
MYSIGELSKRTAVKVPTIRYYEEIGLIEPFDRTAGNQRRYDTEGLRRLTFIKHARDLGLPLDDVRDLIAMEETPGRPCAAAHAIARSHLDHIRERIVRLQRLEAELARIAATHDHGTIETCGVLEALGDHHGCSTEHVSLGRK